MAKPTKEHLDRAKEAIGREEAEKALLQDRSGPPAPRPSSEFIESHTGNVRTSEERAKAISDRAKAYARNEEPAAEYVEFLGPKKKHIAPDHDR